MIVEDLRHKIESLSCMDLNLMRVGTPCVRGKQETMQIPYPDVRYDYANQAWVQDGRYVRCGHPEVMACNCYGRLHAGEPIILREREDRP